MRKDKTTAADSKALARVMRKYKELHMKHLATVVENVDLGKRLSDAQEEIAEKDETLTRKVGELEAATVEIARLKGKISRIRSEMISLQLQLSQREDQIDELTSVPPPKLQGLDDVVIGALA